MGERGGPLLCILVDGLRHDYIDGDQTPHLSRLALQGTRRPLRPILGYSDSIRAAIFTGEYPEQTGYWMEYCYRPVSSPWQGLDRWAPLDRLPSDFVQRVVKFGVSRTVMRRRAVAQGQRHLDLRHVPLRAIDRFDLTLRENMVAPGALGTATIFDTCREQGSSFRYLSTTNMSGSQILREAEKIEDDVALVFVYIHQIDMASHLFGIEGRAFGRSLRQADELVGSLTETMRRRFPATSPIVFADHGMSTLERQVSLQGLLRHPAYLKRFFVALDATMVRLWFFDEDESLRGWVRDYVSSRLPGRFLTEDDRRTYRLRIDRDLYGEDIFLTRPGWGVFPNFHSYARPKAMHAYDPNEREQAGVFIGPAAVGDGVGDVVDIVDIAPMIRGFLANTARSAPRVAS